MQRPASSPSGLHEQHGDIDCYILTALSEEGGREPHGIGEHPTANSESLKGLLAGSAAEGQHKGGRGALIAGSGLAWPSRLSAEKQLCAGHKSGVQLTASSECCYYDTHEKAGMVACT